MCVWVCACVCVCMYMQDICTQSLLIYLLY